MMDRKRFLKLFGVLTTGFTAAGTSPLLTRAANIDYKDAVTITILYTNDTHSRIKPFPESAGELAGLGGYARRAAVVKSIREKNEHVLLLDAGDMFQGTPYFNFYNGELELDLMSKMKYDAAAVGNHEFDNGVDGFAEVAPHAEFPFLAANYHVRDTPMEPFVKSFIVKELGGIKVGIFGLGIAFENLVLEKLHEGVRYRKADLLARAMVRTLREYKDCDYVICLSHLGYRYDDDRISDWKLAQNVNGIDLIIGGHTHTFLDEPVTVRTPENNITRITQVGWGGVILGRIDVTFTPENKPDQTLARNLPISEPSIDKI